MYCGLKLCTVNFLIRPANIGVGVFARNPAVSAFLSHLNSLPVLTAETPIFVEDGAVHNSLCF